MAGAVPDEGVSQARGRFSQGEPFRLGALVRGHPQPTHAPGELISHNVLIKWFL